MAPAGMASSRSPTPFRRPSGWKRPPARCRCRSRGGRSRRGEPSRRHRPGPTPARSSWVSCRTCARTGTSSSRAWRAGRHARTSRRSGRRWIVSPADGDPSAMERMLAIKAMPVFVDVHPDELAVIAQHARLHTFRRGETVYAGPAAPVSSIHLILEGRVTEHRGGRPFITHGPHRVLGGEDALALFAGDVVAVADEDTRTLAIERDQLREVLEDNFGVLSAALRGVAEATLRLRRRIVPSAGFPAPRSDVAAPDHVLDDPGERVAFLWEHTWLRHARIRMLGQLAADAESVALAGGDTVWAAGDRAEHALVVVAGRVHCETADGLQQFEAASGTVLGLEEALAADARWFGTVVREPGSALRISRAALLDVLEDDPDSALALLAAIATIASGLRDEVARGAEQPA